MSELESARVLAQVKMALLKYTSFVFLEVLSKTWPPIVKTKVSACTLWCFPFVFQTDVGIPYWNLHGNWEWVRMNLLKEIHLSFFWKSCQKPGLQSWKRRFLSACTFWCFPSALQRDIGIPHWNLHGNWGRGGQNATIDIALGNWSLSLSTPSAIKSKLPSNWGFEQPCRVCLSFCALSDRCIKFPKQGTDLIDLRLTWKEMENSIYGDLWRFLENFLNFLKIWW